MLNISCEVCSLFYLGTVSIFQQHKGETGGHRSTPLPLGPQAYTVSKCQRVNKIKRLLCEKKHGCETVKQNTGSFNLVISRITSSHSSLILYKKV